MQKLLLWANGRTILGSSKWLHSTPSLLPPCPSINISSPPIPDVFLQWSVSCFASFIGHLTPSVPLSAYSVSFTAPFPNTAHSRKPSPSQHSGAAFTPPYIGPTTEDTWCLVPGTALSADTSTKVFYHFPIPILAYLIRTGLKSSKWMFHWPLK